MGESGTEYLGYFLQNARFVFVSLFLVAIFIVNDLLGLIACSGRGNGLFSFSSF